ncbi:NAD(P)-binding domain-containing protein [Spirosoma sp. SC4-14]|uniref:NADPH-dependent F420 reductase n=1 Tax=Spirosoma sp. SC4-14 TaxID=3128900 RepID=UPI0030CA6D08
MKIGIIGAGHIGHTLARLFVRAGHEVALSNSRGPESLNDIINELGPDAHADTIDNAAAFGEVILLAVPWRSPEALPHPDLVANKIVIDAMNPYAADSTIIDLGDSTSSEEIAHRLPDTRLVKAFNTIWYKHLAEHSDSSKPAEERLSICMASDDPNAKMIIAGLINNIGFTAVDAGLLREGGRKLQPDSPIYGKILTPAEAQYALSNF